MIKKTKQFWIKRDGKIVELKERPPTEFFDSGKLIITYDGKNLWIEKFWHKRTNIRIGFREHEYYVYLSGKQLEALKKILKNL